MVCFEYVCIFFPCSFNIILSATPYICLSYCLQLIFPEVQCNKRFSEAMIWFVRKIWCVQWTLSICSLFTNPQCCHTHTQTKVIYVSIRWFERTVFFVFVFFTKHTNIPMLLKRLAWQINRRLRQDFINCLRSLEKMDMKKRIALGKITLIDKWIDVCRLWIIRNLYVSIWAIYWSALHSLCPWIFITFSV